MTVPTRSDAKSAEYAEAMGTEPITVAVLAERLDLPEDRVRKSLRILAEFSVVRHLGDDLWIHCAPQSHPVPVFM